MQRKNKRLNAGWLRGLVTGTATVAALALTAACGQVSSGQSKAPVPPPVSKEQLSSVVLKVGDQKGNQRALLSAAGLLDNAPYKIEWSTFTSGPPLLEAARAGAIDVGRVGNTPPLFAAAANAQVSIVSASKTNSSSDAILIPPDSPLKSVSDLRGKTVAVAKGSSAHGQLLNTLKANGLTLNDVKVSFLQPSEAFSAFTQKQFDAWAIWDPYTAQAELQAGARVLADGQKTSNGYAFAVASKQSLSDPAKNAAIGEYVSRLAKAYRWNAEHPEEQAKAWAADTGLPIEVTRKSVERRDQLPVPLDQTLVDSEQNLADAFADAKVLPTRFRFEDFIDRRFDAQAVAAQ